MSDGALATSRGETYDLAVAYLRAVPLYFVADHVKAAKRQGLSTLIAGRPVYQIFDLDCYDRFDRIYTVSDEVRLRFSGDLSGIRERRRSFII